MKKKKNVGLSRKKADELLTLLRERATAVNADDQYLFAVSRITVFGSYLTDKPKLGDLDVCAVLVPKDTNKDSHWDKRNKQERECTSRSFIDRLFWPQNKVVKALRGGNVSFSFHCPSDLEALVEDYGAATKVIFEQ